MTLRILGLIGATVVAFMTFGIMENWELFEGTWRGEAVLPEAPAPDEVERVIREVRAAQQSNRVIGLEGSAAHRASLADLAYREDQGITQTLEYGQLKIGTVSGTGPASFSVDTRESLDLGLARSGGEPRSFRLVGSWTYAFRGTAAGFGLIDLQPLEVEVQAITSVPLTAAGEEGGP